MTPTRVKRKKGRFPYTQKAYRPRPGKENVQNSANGLCKGWVTESSKLLVEGSRGGRSSTRSIGNTDSHRDYRESATDEIGSRRTP
jgi:hypothetical protein